MSDVILFMWLADVAGNAREVLGPMLVACGVGTILVAIGTLIYATDYIPRDERDTFIMRAFKRMLWQLIFVVPAVITLLVLPSKNTMHLAAALNAGKIIVNSPLGQKASQAAETILDRIIAEAGSKSKDEKK